MFKAMDAHNSGTINVREMRNGLRKKGSLIPEVQKARLRTCTPCVCTCLPACLLLPLLLLPLLLRCLCKLGVLGCRCPVGSAAWPSAHQAMALVRRCPVAQQTACILLLRVGPAPCLPPPP
jgi:hypothetical protein